MDVGDFYGKRARAQTESSTDSSDVANISISDNSDDEFRPMEEDDTSSSENMSESSSEKRDIEPTPPALINIPNQQSVTPPLVWNENVTARGQIAYVGNHGMKKIITHNDNSDVMPIEIFNQFFDKPIIELFVVETNR